MLLNYYHPLSNEKAASESSFWCNLLAFIIATLCLVWAYRCGLKDFFLLFFLHAFLLTIFSIGFECLFFKKNSLISRLKIYRKISWKRVFYKEVALLVTMAVIGFIYWLFPMYSVASMAVFYIVLRFVVPFMLISSLPYFALMDKIDPEPDDVYYHLGYALTHFKKTLTRFELANYARSWLVKVFWVPLMVPSAISSTHWFMRFISNWPTVSYLQLAIIIADACFFIDITYAAVGYLINFKIINTHTRTAEPTLLGWGVALFCYWPFWDVLFGPFFLDYNHLNYQNILDRQGILIWIWIGIIFFLQLIYAFGTIAAGVRFSNLTYRGLWNTGPYKYTKHPAYVFKNLSWWFISMPFMASSLSDAIRWTILLCCGNFMYYMRAKTEERHLSHYPEYVEYALMMNEKSIFRWVAKIFPFLKYKPLPKEDRIFEVTNNNPKIKKTRLAKPDAPMLYKKQKA